MERVNTVFALIDEEKQRQMRGIELIASENFVSDQAGYRFVPDQQVCRGLSRQAILRRLSGGG